MENLDSMTAAELMAFWARHRYGTRKESAALFDGATPAGYTRVAKALANYAANKATAIECRLSGKIQIALDYERICDQIYDRLPAYARW